MGDFFKRIRDWVVQFYKNLDRNRKIMTIVGLIVVVLALTFGILKLTETKYVAIAQGLTPAEALNVTTKLDDLGITWIDEQNTSVILVASSDVSRARMELAGDLSSSNFSWLDVFDSESITMTSQTREQMYIVATASLIEESIKTIDGVEDVKVILQIPKDSNYFIKDEIKSKASVVLVLKNGYSLDEARVNGIVNLVVSSVKDLTADNVAILDSTGIQLNDKESSGTFTANSQYDLQVKIENQLKNDLTDFLEKIYGVGNVEVKPYISLDFNQQTETQTLFSPPVEGSDTGLTRSVSRITEDVVNSTAASGIPGTDTNSGDITTTVESTTDGSSYNKASETLNYELNEIYREIVKSQGDVTDLSIGVLINSNALVDAEISEEHYAELLSLISKSAGTGESNISIVAQAFPDPMDYYDVYTADDTAGTLFGMPLWIIVVIVVIVVVGLVAVIIVSRRNKSRKEAESLAELEKIEKHKESLEELGMEEEDKGSPKYHIEKFVDTNPEAAAALLRAWLNEG